MTKNLRTLIKGTYVFRLLLYVIVFTPFISIAQVKFSAVCPNKRIGKNEYLQIQYLVENASNVEQIEPPSFKDFLVVSGPNQQSSMSDINGAIKQYVSIEFILKPNRPGNYMLPPATAKVNGKTFLSNSLSVQVTNKSSVSTLGGTSVSPFGNIMADVLPAPSVHQYDDYILHKGEDLREKIKKNLFVRLEVNKPTCYVGEPIVATYKLYTRLKSESSLIKTPSFNGFSVSEMEMPDSYSTTTEKYNGRDYTVYVLRKVQLYPLQAGSIDLDAIEVENNITFIKAEYADSKKGDIFYDMLHEFVDAATPAEGIENQKITIQSKPQTIIVKPLPAINQPKDFKGAVGTFKINVAVEKNKLTTDEAGNLTVSISGGGNMEMINAPDIVWPQGIEAFEPKSSESLDKSTVPLRGEKKFSYPFTVSKPGKYTIPAINFSYFDVTAQNYKTLATTPLTITVKRGFGLTPAFANQIKRLTGNKPGASGKFLNWGFLFSIAAFVIVGLLALFMRKRGKKTSDLTARDSIIKQPVQPASAEAMQVPLNPLSEAKAMLLTDNENFYSTLNNCLRKYLAGKLNFPEKELTKKKINELLGKHNVGLSTTLMLSSLLENIEVNLYAPVSSAYQRHDVYARASEVISLLDKQVT